MIIARAGTSAIGAPRVNPRRTGSPDRLKIGSERANLALIAEDSGRKGMCRKARGCRASNHDRGETSLLHPSGPLVPPPEGAALGCRSRRSGSAGARPVGGAEQDAPDPSGEAQSGPVSRLVEFEVLIGA